MTYVKNGGYIRLVPDTLLPRLVETGFIPMAESAQKLPPKSPARPRKKEQTHGGA